MELNKHEQTFEVKPVGIKYICEFCGEGEQILDKTAAVIESNPPMFKHICNKCGKSMTLPKPYPMIFWECENDPLIPYTE